MNIDNTDFIILKCLNDHDRPLWKNKIHQFQPDILQEEVSVQTVGRRVDKLRDNEYLDSCIVSPDDIKRDLIIAFKPTNKGKQALAEKRKQLLLDEVRCEVFNTDDVDRRLEQDTMIELIGDEFDLESDTQKRLHEEFARDELLTFLTVHYVSKEVRERFTADQIEQFLSLTEQEQELNALLSEPLPEQAAGH